MELRESNSIIEINNSTYITISSSSYEKHQTIYIVILVQTLSKFYFKIIIS
jgi:hypothetical protein